MDGSNSNSSQKSGVEGFLALRQVVENWTTDLVKQKSVIADILLGQFYRWIKNPRSKLYDPAIYKQVHSMMKRVFLQLLGEFKKLGAVIIHANFNKVFFSFPFFFFFFFLFLFLFSFFSNTQNK